MVELAAHNRAKSGQADSRETSWVVEEVLAAGCQGEGLGEGAAVDEAALVVGPDPVLGLP